MQNGEPERTRHLQKETKRTKKAEKRIGDLKFEIADMRKQER
jgi:hypothetical protein